MKARYKMWLLECSQAKCWQRIIENDQHMIAKAQPELQWAKKTCNAFLNETEHAGRIFPLQ